MINGSLFATQYLSGYSFCKPVFCSLFFPGTLFALVFHRTDMLLGIHLDRGRGPENSLSAKIIVEVVLLIFIVRYPASFDWFVKISLVFSGFLLVNSIITAKTACRDIHFFHGFGCFIRFGSRACCTPDAQTL